METADELEETTVALKMDTAIFDYVAIILACFHPDAAWDQAKRMPSRELEPDEIAFSHLREAKG